MLFVGFCVSKNVLYHFVLLLDPAVQMDLRLNVSLSYISLMLHSLYVFMQMWEEDFMNN